MIHGGAESDRTGPGTVPAQREKDTAVQRSFGRRRERDGDDDDEEIVARVNACFNVVAMWMHFCCRNEDIAGMLGSRFRCLTFDFADADALRRLTDEWERDFRTVAALNCLITMLNTRDWKGLLRRMPHAVADVLRLHECFVALQRATKHGTYCCAVVPDHVAQMTPDGGVRMSMCANVGDDFARYRVYPRSTSK